MIDEDAKIIEKVDEDVVMGADDLVISTNLLSTRNKILRDVGIVIGSTMIGCLGFLGGPIVGVITVTGGVVAGGSLVLGARKFF